MLIIINNIKKSRFIEQKKFVDYGRELFADQNLHFFHSIEKCLQSQNAKVILFSSILQYMEQPYEFLKQIENFEFIIIDRTPFFADKDRIVIQKVSPKIYDASYPCWIFNEKKFVDFFIKEMGYQLVADFEAHIGTIIELDDSQATYKGFILKKYNII